MFKILVIQATNNLSDERAEFLINDRLSFMRFLGLGLEDRVPDRANNAKIENPLACRACVRRAKGSDGAIHQNYRDRPSNDQDRNGQSRLQHQTIYLPAQDRRRMTGLLRKATHSTHYPIAIKLNQ
jgi:Transposase domain (DUF772)